MIEKRIVNGPSPPCGTSINAASRLEETLTVARANNIYGNTEVGASLIDSEVRRRDCFRRERVRRTRYHLSAQPKCTETSSRTLIRRHKARFVFLQLLRLTKSLWQNRSQATPEMPPPTGIEPIKTPKRVRSRKPISHNHKTHRISSLSRAITRVIPQCRAEF